MVPASVKENIFLTHLISLDKILVLFQALKNCKIHLFPVAGKERS